MPDHRSAIPRLGGGMAEPTNDCYFENIVQFLERYGARVVLR
ncbi:hypothetical protein [Streptomyces sp. CBMA156]|nr:hypothetical protein [Streptomyces sp. CBMA156]